MTAHKEDRAEMARLLDEARNGVPEQPTDATRNEAGERKAAKRLRDYNDWRRAPKEPLVPEDAGREIEFAWGEAWNIGYAAAMQAAALTPNGEGLVELHKRMSNALQGPMGSQPPARAIMDITLADADAVVGAACRIAELERTTPNGEGVPMLPDILTEGERLASETPKTNGAYLWTDLVGALQTAIAEERARHV